MKFLARREIKLLTSFGGRIIFLDNLLLRFKLIFETEAWWKADLKQVNTQKKTQQNETLQHFHGQHLHFRNTDTKAEMFSRALSLHRNYSADLNPFTVLLFPKPHWKGWTYGRTSPGADVAEALWVSPASPSWTNTPLKTSEFCMVRSHVHHIPGGEWRSCWNCGDHVNTNTMLS